ncbi:nucleotide-binding protein, SMC family [alpha proteobacterium HIMB59]|nr:nucleotide-binding protein, SMC family [alpha proteobacterium HIMB59]
MLSLDKLSIKGFKSFVEPTEFEIKSGLTGIVGPNGCGKSNIVEAIRFGLGEVSAKQLRGKEIDDLIFNGTDNRPSWNLAEVGLFVNIDGTDLENKFESKSLEIARKIWRGEGTNSYINGKEVRLKDIQLLFADASTSARSTSIVSQGRIGAITQAKPEDRKMVLEEAAGILGLQSRRHDSELRLKAATNNLLRVEDVITTYEEQLAILKKQSKEAERFRNISTLIKNAEASVFYVKRNQIQTILQKLEDEKNEIKIKLADFQGDVSSQDQAFEDLKVKIPPMREKSYSLNSELDRLNMTVENLKQEELRFEEHKTNLEHRVKQLQQDLEVENKQNNDTQIKIQEIRNEINDISSKDFESNPEKTIGQSDRSLLNNISFEKEYENSVAAIFGKELLASLDKDEVFYWSENIVEEVSSSFNFPCKVASELIKAPDRIANKLNNVAVIEESSQGYEFHKNLKPGQAIVDKEGNLWRWDGLFVSSSYEANISSILSELKEKRLNDLKKQILEWERISEITIQKINDLNDRIKTAKEELDISQNNPGDIDSKRQFLLNKIKDLTEEKRLFDNELQEKENLLEQLSKDLRNKEQNFSVVKEDLIRKESEISNFNNNLQQLILSCREKINVDLLNLENEIDKLKKDEDLETAEKRVIRLVTERERIGAVNLLAEDEYTKLREKVNDTIKDKNEIQESIEKLHDAINKINKEGVSRLRDAFQIVNENFERLFTKLFGGGKAYLKLIQNDEDPLNSGLEIFASPPGKKMQNITLLSGGEQALTAISLLFAVFIANPSPFCILDEVDAPLDDNNVDRFCSMVEEISEKVQTKFIIITHNRMTMSRVDRLYGVTMPEEGVSQIVSVELEEAVKYAE